MATSISVLLVECLSLFNALVARDGLVVHDAEVPKSLWLDELGRLRVWAANIGAHQTGQSSLDYRLRDASHLKDQIIRLLERLQRLLVDLSEFLDDTLEGAEAQDSDDEDTTELEQIYNGLVEVIGSLFQMSMLIRRPARHDRLLGTKKEDAVTFEPYDRQHVLEKYPRANDVVVDRLGSAISRRRADLKYRERHHAKLSQGINRHAARTQESHDRESTIFSETVATEYKEPNIQFNETGSQSGISQTSYAPTLLEGGNAITVPPPPKEATNEQPFECPYCFFITTIKNKRSWARHVFRDIMPYICIFSDCPTPNRLYDSRREWYQHLTNNHISPSGAGELHECSLCHEPGFSALSLERHLGRHLEELALFAMPRSMGDEYVDSDKSRHSSGQDASSHNESVNSSRDEAAQEIKASSAISAEFLHTLPADVRNELNQREWSSQLEEQEEVDYQIKCICKYVDDDGNTVYCDKCKTWQHIECYYPDEDVPETHLCTECKPRRLDRNGARERQKRQREQRGYGADGVRSNALISGPGYDGHVLDAMPMLVINSGLPKRAAAPTFGDTVADLESSTGTMVTSRRLGVPSKDGGGEPGSERDDPGLQRRRGSLSDSSNSSLYTSDVEQEIFDHDDLAHRFTATSGKLEKPLSELNESTKLSADEYSEGNRYRDQKLRDMDQIHAQQTVPQEVTGNASIAVPSAGFSLFEESHANRAIPHTPRQNTPVETTDKYESLLSTESLNNQDESGEGGPGQNQGALSSLKRFFGFGSRQEGSETEVVASSTASGKSIRPKTTRKQYVEQDDVNLRSGRNDSVPLPPRIRHVDSNSDSYRRRGPRRDSLDLSNSPPRTPTDEERADADIIQGIQDDKAHTERAASGLIVRLPSIDSDTATGLDPSIHNKIIQRNVSFVANTSTRRPARDDEVTVMRSFAAHAGRCSLCADPYGTYLRGGTLCDRGHAYAKDVAEYIYSKGGRPFSVVDRMASDEKVQIEIPAGCDAVEGLIKAVDRGLRVGKRIPVVGKDGTYPVVERRTTSEERRMNRRDRYSTVEVAPRRERRRPAVYAEGRGSLYERDEDDRRRRRDEEAAIPVVIVVEPRRGKRYER